MALRSLSRKGIEVGARVGKSRAHNLGAERKASSLVGQGHGGHFGRPPTTAYGQGVRSGGVILKTYTFTSPKIIRFFLILGVK